MSMLTGTRRALLGGADVEINKVCPSITPTLGAELVVNGNFTNWTGDNPDNWTVLGEDANNYITESGVGDQARFVSNNTSLVRMRPTLSILSIGTWYRTSIDGVATVSGSVDFGTNVTAAMFATISAVQTYVSTGRADDPALRLSRTAACDVTVDNISAKAITFATAITYLGTRSKQNGTYQCTPTIADNTQGGVLLCYLNATNFLMLIVNRGVTNQAQLLKCLDGTYTSVVAGNITYGAASVLKVIASGTNCSLYYNGAQVGITTAVAEIATLGKAVYGFNTLDGNTVGTVTTTGATS